MPTTDNISGTPGDEAYASIDSKFKILSERVAKTADPDLKEFLSGILKATETTLYDLRSVRDQLDGVQASADAAAAAAMKAKREASETAVKADIRAEAMAAGAVDASDILPFVKLNDVKIDDEGKSNVGELISGLKRAKPHLFASVSTSAAHPVPKPKGAISRNALEMSAGEYRAAKARFTKRS